jgi:4-amino-4-deoxy-L-arabinose transferase-like glycosyltransferase
MLRSHSPSPRTSHLAWVLSIGVPIAFFGVTGWIMPVAETLQFDPDEGIELAKVTLYNQGYTLYDQIWNDQPPLLTLLLAHWLNLFGHYIVAARLLTLSFAALLVGAFYNTLVLILGIRAALIGTLGLSLTFGFMRLSVSVMRGLPALALAMVAIYFLIWESCGRSPKSNPKPFGVVGSMGAIAVSGICLGLSLQLKFYTLLLVPACLLHLVLGVHWQNGFKSLKVRRFSLVFLWLVTFGLTILAIGWLTHTFNVQQLLGTHLDKSSQVALQREPSWLILLMFFTQDLDYSLLAGVGIYGLLRQKIRWPILPLVWLLTVLIALAHYQPLWDHYYPLIAVPVVWLATYGVVQGCARAKHHDTLRGLTTGVLIFAIALTPIKLAVNAVLNHQFVQESRTKLEVIEQVRAFRSSTHWLFTDLPIVAFYTNLKVPPELAVFSLKRIQSGSLGAEELTRILQTYQPEQVLLGRYPQVREMLEPYLKQHYCKCYEKNRIVQYVLKSVPNQSACKIFAALSSKEVNG